MLFFLLVGLLLGAVTVVFALQNIAAVSVTFLVWQLNGSLALILALAVTSGVLISILVSFPEIIKTSMKISALKKQNKKLEDEIVGYKKIIADSNTVVVENNNPTIVEKIS